MKFVSLKDRFPEIKINGQKIQYFKFISSLKNDDCNKALKRICPQIDMEKICRIVDEISCISDLQKEFYKTMLRERKELILDFSYQKLCKREHPKVKNEF